MKDEEALDNEGDSACDWRRTSKLYAAELVQSLDQAGYAVVPKEPTEAMVLDGLVALVGAIKASTPEREPVKDGQVLSDSESAQRYMSIGAEIRSGKEVAAAYRAMLAALTEKGRT